METVSWTYCRKDEHDQRTATEQCVVPGDGHRMQRNGMGIKKKKEKEEQESESVIRI